MLRDGPTRPPPDLVGMGEARGELGVGVDGRPVLCADRATGCVARGARVTRRARGPGGRQRHRPTPGAAGVQKFRVRAYRVPETAGLGVRLQGSSAAECKEQKQREGNFTVKDQGGFDAYWHGMARGGDLNAEGKSADFTPPRRENAGSDLGDLTASAAADRFRWEKLRARLCGRTPRAPVGRVRKAANRDSSREGSLK